MLVRASDRRVHRYRPVDHPGRFCSSQQAFEHPIPGALRSHPLMPSPQHLPRPEHGRNITLSDPAPIAVDDALHNHPGVRERPAPPTRPPRQQPLDHRPLIIRQHLKTRHAPSIPATPQTICQTHPRCVRRVTRQHRARKRTGGPRSIRVNPPLRSSIALRRGAQLRGPTFVFGVGPKARSDLEAQVREVGRLQESPSPYQRREG